MLIADASASVYDCKSHGIECKAETYVFESLFLSGHDTS